MAISVRNFMGEEQTVVPDENTVRFILGENKEDWIDVTLREGRIYIQGVRCIILRPDTCNIISVDLR